jgi:hypothetical protein
VLLSFAGDAGLRRRSEESALARVPDPDLRADPEIVLDRVWRVVLEQLDREAAAAASEAE